MKSKWKAINGLGPLGLVLSVAFTAKAPEIGQVSPVGSQFLPSNRTGALPASSSASPISLQVQEEPGHHARPTAQAPAMPSHAIGQAGIAGLRNPFVSSTAQAPAVPSHAIGQAE